MSLLNRISLLFFLCITSVAVSSCEEILDADGLPYEEKLVIHGILIADTSDNIIQISRTLPVNTVFDTNAAFLKDAIGSISDGDRTYPLMYVGYSGKYRAEGLTPQSGKTYTLSVSWGTLKASASTLVPTQSRVDTAYVTTNFSPFGYDEYLVTCKLLLPPSTSVQLEVMVIGDQAGVFGSDYRLFAEQNKEQDGFVYSRTNIYAQRDQKITGVWVRHYTFAPGYYEYRQSRRNDSFEDLGSPALIRWNVSGDAIGIFFGCAIGQTTIDF